MCVLCTPGLDKIISKEYRGRGLDEEVDELLNLLHSGAHEPVKTQVPRPSEVCVQVLRRVCDPLLFITGVRGVCACSVCHSGCVAGLSDEEAGEETSGSCQHATEELQVRVLCE